MFRRLSESLPQDPIFPTNLEKLGYYINEHDQIRMISHPDEPYRYKINRCEQINDLYKETHKTCVRTEILNRLHSLGLETVRLPLGTPVSSPHIPILITANLSSHRRILVYFGERGQDLGVFAYRIIGGEEGINAGSAVNFVKAVQSNNTAASQHDATGIVIANPGQLIWCRAQGRAMGLTEWSSLPTETAVHPRPRIDDEVVGRNLVEGNRDEVEHVEYVFEQVLQGAGEGKAMIDVIGSEWTGAAVVRYLGRNWTTWSTRINAICLIAPLHSMDDLLPEDNPNPKKQVHDLASRTFAHFISTRCRAYLVHQSPQGTLIEGSADYGCNIYASGEQLYLECVIVRAWEDMLRWFERLRVRGPDAEEKWAMSTSGPVLTEKGKSGQGDGDEKESKDELESEAGKVDEAWIPGLDV